MLIDGAEPDQCKLLAMDPGEVLTTLVDAVQLLCGRLRDLPVTVDFVQDDEADRGDGPDAKR